MKNYLTSGNGAPHTRALIGVLVVAVVAGALFFGLGYKRFFAPEKPIVLATTTSTQDSGILDYLLPVFAKRTGIAVKVVAVGSGEALAMGQRGDADAVLAHSPAAEVDFVNKGFGIDRRAVMHNDMIVVGPASDPAGIRGGKDAAAALKKIAQAGSPWVSRGDKSGTQAKEVALWAKTGLPLVPSPGWGGVTPVRPSGSWYIEAGQGMGEVLKMASEKKAYTLTDRSTYLAMKGGLSLDILVEGDANLFNPYHAMEVNPEKNPAVNFRGAQKFVDWLVSDATQKLIADFGKDKYGMALFFPDAGGTAGK